MESRYNLPAEAVDRPFSFLYVLGRFESLAHYHDDARKRGCTKEAESLARDYQQNVGIPVDQRHWIREQVSAIVAREQK